MSASSKGNLKLPNNVGPGGESLYYKNIGLFYDGYLDSISTAENDPFVIENWDTHTSTDFEDCFEFIRSKWNSKKDSFRNISEQDLQEKWIGPILQKLGWHYRVNVTFRRHERTVRPDYLLFSDENQSDRFAVNESKYEFLTPVVALADAKQMGVSLDGGAKESNSNPSFQIFSYLTMCEKEWGILTDGQFWRLYSTKSKSQSNSYYEIDLEALINFDDREAFKYFFNFFRRDAFLKDPHSNQSFLDVVFQEGERSAVIVETDLRKKAFELVEKLCQGFYEGKAETSEDDLKDIYNHSLYFLFRLLFILNCEARRILDVFNTTDYFEYSLRKLCIEKRDQLEKNKRWSSRDTSTYETILKLFRRLQKGDPSIGIPEKFADEAFRIANGSFFEQNAVSDIHLGDVLIELAYTRDKSDNRLKSVDYKSLSADHLGSIFEGLLEFSPAIQNRKFVLLNGNGERRISGSFYTPEYIVNKVVAKVLSPLVEGKKAAEILKLKVFDPAMGSGHFLLGVLKFLEHALQDALLKSNDPKLSPGEAKWLVLHNNVFGRDINPLATELAKFSLWIYSARAGHEIEPLGDQLICGDSLVAVEDLVGEYNLEAFDAVVGNPPYGFHQIHGRDNKHKFKELFKSASHSYEHYFLFLEQGLKLLEKKRGRLGFIVPVTWLNIPSADELRRVILDGFGLSEIIWIEDPVFKEASVNTLIAVAQSRSVEQTKVYITNTDALMSQIEAEPLLLPVSKFKTDGYEIRIFESELEGVVLDRIESSSVALGTVAKPCSGYNPYEVGKGLDEKGNLQSAKTVESRPFHSSKKMGKEWKVEISGKCLRRFGMKVPQNQWVKYGPWLAAARDPKNFQGPRILVQEITGGQDRRIIATFTDEEIYYSRDVIPVLCSDEYNSKVLLAIVNSWLMCWRHQRRSPKAKKGIFPKLLVRDLNGIPVPSRNTLLKKKKLVEKIESAVDELMDLRLKDFDLQNSNAVKFSKLDRKLDLLVYELFELKPEEIKKIESARTVDLSD